MYEIIATHEDGSENVLTNIVDNKEAIFNLEMIYSEERNHLLFENNSEALVIMHKLLDLMVLRSERLKKRKIFFYSTIQSFSSKYVTNIAPSSFSSCIIKLDRYKKIFLGTYIPICEI